MLLMFIPLVLPWGCGETPPSGNQVADEVSQGKEMARIRLSGHRYSIDPSQPAAVVMGETRKHLIQQGITAFRKVVDQDPRNHEAVLCLGLCLVDKEMQEFEEGLQRLETLTRPGVPSNWVWAARWIIASHYDHPTRDVPKAATLYRLNWESLTSASDRESYHEVLDGHYQKAFSMGRMEESVFLDWLLQRDEVALEAALDRETPDKPLRGDRMFRPRLAAIALLLNKNPALVSRYVEPTVDALEAKRPDLAPYLTAGLATLQATNLPPPIEARHLQSIEWCREHPGEVYEPASFFRESLKAAMVSHATYARKMPGLRVAQLMVDQGPPHLTGGDLAWVHFHVGWLHRHDGEFQLAAEAFDRMEHRETHVLAGGYWGPFGVYNGKAMAEECRLLLAGKSPGERWPAREMLGEPVLAFFSPSTFQFACDGPRLWFLQGDTLIEYDKQTQQTNHLSLVVAGGAPGFPIMAVGERSIWLGTQGSGVIAVDKATKATRRFGVAEGLYGEYINQLHVQPDRVWLGFADERPLGPNRRTLPGGGKGMGYIALPDMTFVGVHQVNTTNLEVAPKGNRFSGEVVADSNAPPSVIRHIFQLNERELYVVSHQHLHRWDLRDKHWSRLHQGNYLMCATGNEQYLVTGALEPGSRAQPETGHWGGISIQDRSQGTWKHLGRGEGLPHNDITALAMDGDRAWVGSRGYVAKINLPEASIDRLYLYPGRTYPFRQVEIDGDELWFASTEDIRGGQTRLFRMKLE